MVAACWIIFLKASLISVSLMSVSVFVSLLASELANKRSRTSSNSAIRSVCLESIISACLVSDVVWVMSEASDERSE